jgi:hypothetical protein
MAGSSVSEGMDEEPSRFSSPGVPLRASNGDDEGRILWLFKSREISRPGGLSGAVEVVNNRSG